MMDEGVRAVHNTYTRFGQLRGDSISTTQEDIMIIHPVKARSRLMVVLLFAANALLASAIVQELQAKAAGEEVCMRPDCRCTGNVCQNNGATFMECSGSGDCE